MNSYSYFKTILEIKKSVLNLLKSSFSSKEISELSDISYTTISELRNGKRNLDSTSFQIIQSLYRIASEKGLSQKQISFEEKKGNNNIVSLEVPIKKIIVAFNEMDLFGLGFLLSENPIPLIPKDPNQIYRIPLPNGGIMIDSNDIVYQNDTFNLNFNVNYGGTGPNNFVRFLEDYSKIPTSELQEKIFHESILEYDFRYDSLTPVTSKLPEIPFQLYKKNNKLILAIEDSNPFQSNYDDKYLDENDSDKIYKLSKCIKNIMQIMRETYNFEVSPTAVHYVPHLASDKKIYNTEPEFDNYFGEKSQYHMIFEFANFEIWLPYSLHLSKGNPFKHPVYQQFFENLGYYLNEDEIGSIRKFLKERKENQINLESIRSLFFQE